VKIEQNIKLALHTSYKIGGEASYYIKPQNEEQFVEAINFALENSLPYFVLGKGSNILVSDTGFDGLIIDTKHHNRISFTDKGVEVESGALLTKLVISCIEADFAGLEDLAGIPGTVGGGVVMNAGAYSQTISDCITTVKWFDIKSKRIIESTKEELNFGYRTSQFKKESAIILSAIFAPTKGDSAQLKSKVSEIQQKRRDKQPLNFPSCGSVFKRPEGNYAGALIESAGLKGKTIGGAQISDKHSNFIINIGDAKAEDVREIISLVRESVYKDSNILLEPELIFIGVFKTPIWSC
jgi:UDP-N-acetylmuramate dehydrogenase